MTRAGVNRRPGAGVSLYRIPPSGYLVIALPPAWGYHWPRAGGLSIWRGGWGFSVCFLHIERCGSRPVSIERQSFPAFWMSSCTASVPHSLQLIVFGSLFSGRDHGPQLVIGQLTKVHAGHRSAGQTDIDCLFGVLSDGIAHRSEGLGIPS